MISSCAPRNAREIVPYVGRTACRVVGPWAIEVNRPDEWVCDYPLTNVLDRAFFTINFLGAQRSDLKQAIDFLCSKDERPIRVNSAYLPVTYSKSNGRLDAVISLPRADIEQSFDCWAGLTMTQGLQHALLAAATDNKVGTSAWLIERFVAGKNVDYDGMPYESSYAEPTTLRADMEKHYGPVPKMLEGVTPMQWLEDAEMLTREGVVVGLRSVWMRRVATPIVQASRHMQRNIPLERRVSDSLGIVEQCRDPDLRMAAKKFLFSMRRGGEVSDDVVVTDQQKEE